MNRLSSEQRAKVLGCLIEGCSIRSTVRKTGVAKKTIVRLVVEWGFCANYQDRVFRNLNADSEGWRSAFRTDVDHDSEVMPISVPN